MAMPALHAGAGDRKNYNEAKFERSQVNCNRTFTLSSLPNSSRQLLIPGFAPTIVVLDTGADSIILGKTFASQIDLCQPGLLEPIGILVTANGAEEISLPKTTSS